MLFRACVLVKCIDSCSSTLEISEAFSLWLLLPLQSLHCHTWKFDKLYFWTYSPYPSELNCCFLFSISINTCGAFWGTVSFGWLIRKVEIKYQYQKHKIEERWSELRRSEVYVLFETRVYRVMDFRIWKLPTSHFSPCPPGLCESSPSWWQTTGIPRLVASASRKLGAIAPPGCLTMFFQSWLFRSHFLSGRSPLLAHEHVFRLLGAPPMEWGEKHALPPSVGKLTSNPGGSFSGISAATAEASRGVARLSWGLLCDGTRTTKLLDLTWIHQELLFPLPMALCRRGLWSGPWCPFEVVPPYPAESPQFCAHRDTFLLWCCCRFLCF